MNLQLYLQSHPPLQGSFQFSTCNSLSQQWAPFPLDIHMYLMHPFPLPATLPTLCVTSLLLAAIHSWPQIPPHSSPSPTPLTCAPFQTPSFSTHLPSSALVGHLCLHWKVHLCSEALFNPLQHSRLSPSTAPSAPWSDRT